MLARLRPLSDADVVCLLVPFSVLVDARLQQVRAAMTECWHVSVVVVASGVMPEVHPSYVVSAVILRPRGVDDVTRFVNPSSRASVDDFRDDALRLLRMSGGRRQHGFTTRKGLNPETWNPHSYDPLLEREEADLTSFGSGVP